MASSANPNPDLGRPSQGQGLERSHRRWPYVCPLRASRCLCVCLSRRRASPSAGARLSRTDQCWPGRLPAQGDFLRGRGGSQGAREPPRGAAGTYQEHWLQDAARGGASRIGLRTHLAFPELVGAGSVACRWGREDRPRVQTWLGLPFCWRPPWRLPRARPPLESGHFLLWAGWCSHGGSVKGFTVPTRASVWVLGMGVCVSVCQCVTRAVLWG